MTFEISIPTTSGEKLIQVKQGSSIVFVGANGTGKTRLATHIENLLDLNAHRVSAHRALELNPLVASRP
jgi:MoxR-like ATPase